MSDASDAWPELLSVKEWLLSAYEIERRGVERMGDTMDHHPESCMIGSCGDPSEVRRLKLAGADSSPTIARPLSPLFKLYPVVPESV